MNRHFGRAVHAAGFGSRLRNNADNHLIERAVALACLLVLAIGVFLVMQPFLSALLWGIILTSSTWPLHVRLTRALGGRTGTSAAILTLVACAIFLIPLVLLGQNLAENVAQLAAKLQEWRNNNVSEPPSWVAPLPLLEQIAGYLGRLYPAWRKKPEASSAVMLSSAGPSA
jgi:predicted PurR-regulated permease PerM